MDGESVLYTSQDTLVVRTRVAGIDGSVVVKHALRDDAARRLRHEIATLGRLTGVQGVVQMARFEALAYSVCPVLILHDDAGIPLADLLKKRLCDKEVWRLSIGLARALANLHAAGVVHKDLSSHNVVIDSAQGVVLIDFGDATTISEERTVFEHPSLLSGTLEYMSPEQTGRTSRAVDNRSDLYSLGVILYEVATGRLPFECDDPLDLIRDHLTRMPPAPKEVDGRLNQGMSDIIMKLLQKDPDSRYQSASGLLHDLEWLSSTSLSIALPVSLGNQDFPARLVAPPRLVGRAREINRFQDAMARACAGDGSVVLVSGPPGVGKTALIGELRSIVGTLRGWFVSSKFDQHASDALSMQQALRSLGRLLLAEPEHELARQRERLLSHLGGNAAFGPALLPEFSILLGGLTPPSQATDPRNTDARQVQATVDLLRGIASPERPVVLVLDDLHWAPDEVLRLLDALIGAYQPVAGLMVVGAYRSTEIASHHSLQVLLSRWQTENCAPVTVELGNLGPSHLTALIAQMLRMPHRASEELAHALLLRTDGNPFDSIELVNALRSDGLLVQRHGRWDWDAGAINQHIGDRDVIQLLQRRIQRLPDSVIPFLHLLACLGGQVRLQLVGRLMKQETQELEAALWPALQDGILVFERGEQAQLRFKHDLVQQTILHTMDKGCALQTHLRLARGLSTMPEESLLAAEQYLSVVAHGSESLTDDTERRRVMELLEQGALQIEAVNLNVAAQMLTAAIALTKSSHAFDPAKTAMLDIALHRVRYGLGQFELCDEVYAGIINRHPDPLDLTQSACVQICSLAKRDRNDEAIVLGLSLLSELGLTLPIPTRVEEAIVEGQTRLVEWVRNESCSTTDFYRPLMSEPRLCACAALIGQTLHASLPVLGKNLLTVRWLFFQAAELWIAHGPSDDLAAGGLSYAGAFIALETGELQVQRHVLAVASHRQFDVATPELTIRQLVVASHVEGPLQDGIQPMQQLREELRRLGNYSGATATSHTPMWLLDCAETLDAAEAENDFFTAFITSLASQHYLPICRMRRQFFKALRGELTEFTEVDADAETKLGTGDWIYSINYYLLRILLSILCQDRAWLRENVETAAATNILSSVYLGTITRVLAAVWRMEAARAEAGDQRQTWQSRYADDLEWLGRLASQAPANYLHLLHWLEAERAWTAGEFWAACQAFDRAMVKAAQNHRPWHRALIVERAGRFLLEQGLVHSGQRLIALACDGYDAWGAAGKVRAMHQEFAFLAQPRSALAVKAPRHSGTLSAESVDLMAVLRASQALSSETSLPALTGRLAQVLSTLTGASGVELLVRADDTPDWRPSIGAAVELPWAALRYVERTRQTLVLDDAKQDDRFAADPYLAALAQCSMMVLPIVSQGELRALLLLVNAHSRGAFNAERLGAVTLICGQLAVSLDNALLYRSLEQKVAERTSALADVNGQLEQLLRLREGELRTASALKSSIVDNALVAIVTTNAAGTIVDFNPAGEAMFGMARGQAMGSSYDQLFPPHLRQLRQELIDELVRDQIGRRGVRRTTQALRADGVEFPVEVVLWRTDVDQEQYYTSSIRDITEQQRDQELIERQRNELRQSEKLTLMGSLLAGVAHELNNPLTVVVGGATLLQEKCQDTELHGDARRVIDAAQRCARIVRTFLNMARQRQPVRGELKLNELVRGAADMMGYVLRTHGVRLELTLAEDLPVVQGDSDQLGQVILNLMVNAQQAMVACPQPRRLVLQTGWTAEAVGAQQRMWLRVQDSGPGVPDGLQEKVFAPFFTTKAEGTGTGLGLAMCRAIAREHQGDVVLEASHEGASFLLWLPLQAAAASLAPADVHNAPVPPASPGGFHVLVVDDEAELVEVVQIALQAAAFKVTVANSGAGALEQLQRSDFDAIVCDMHMPDMSGEMLWRQLLAQHPGMASRLLFMTGDTFSLHVSQFLADSGRPALYKPFTASSLISTLHRLLCLT